MAQATTPTREGIPTERIVAFSSLFRGRTDVYGTCDFETGKARQVKAPVTEEVIRDHLEGRRILGIYPLVGDRTEFLAFDFDNDDLAPPMACAAAARNYGLSAYIERSKSKGYHVWVFFDEGGAQAAKARRVAGYILEEIGCQGTEVFPKQDKVDATAPYGNFIYAPLYGALVSEGRTAFLQDSGSMEPHTSQWAFLESVELVPESVLDEIIEVNELKREPEHEEKAERRTPVGRRISCGLPICAQRMLNEGVKSHQRVASFRLAVQLKKAGLPYDIAVAALMAWAHKNQPEDGKGIIREREIVDQTAWAYTKGYMGCGCEDEAVAWFCDKACLLYQRRQRRESTQNTPPESLPERQ